MSNICSTETLLVVEGLRKLFGARLAVDGVSLSVGRGETLGLIGPNGAGKTTTMLMIAGVLPRDGGRVQLGESGDPAHPQGRRTLGLAPQSLAIYPQLTALENVMFAGGLHGLRGRALRKRASWALALVGLAERSQDRASGFSGGMLRRLNLACAVVHGPEVLLLDEPTVGVDVESRQVIFESLRHLKGEGMACVYSTHYLDEVRQLCDRVAVFCRGRVAACDTVARVIDRHAPAGDLGDALTALTGTVLAR